MENTDLIKSIWLDVVHTQDNYGRKKVLVIEVFMQKNASRLRLETQSPSLIVAIIFFLIYWFLLHNWFCRMIFIAFHLEEVVFQNTKSRLGTMYLAIWYFYFMGS